MGVMPTQCVVFEDADFSWFTGGGAGGGNGCRGCSTIVSDGLANTVSVASGFLRRDAVTR